MLDVFYVSFPQARDIHFKKTLEGSEAQRSCRVRGWGRLPYKLPTSVSAPQCAVAGRTVPCRAATVSEFPRERVQGKKIHGPDKASRCLAKKLPMYYKIRTTMTKTTNWRAIGENINPCSSMTSPPPREDNRLYNGTRL